jgi:endonuclease YncB( thermonuclease family)
MVTTKLAWSFILGVLAPLALLGRGVIAQESPVLVGSVSRVIDGDTIDVQLSSGPITVRLGSIDAPESNQPWGEQATSALRQLVLREEVALEVMSQDRYERLVAVVYLGEHDVNRWMVEQGHAWAYRRYLEDPAYCGLEHQAREGNRGLWRSEKPVAPWEWRRGATPFTDYDGETVASCVAAKGGSTRSVSIARRAFGDCAIKGNISKNGRIYHLPGSPSYASTRIDESKGERWFCTEQEAQAAGWRPPRS